MFKLSGKLCFLTATLSFGLASGSFAFTDGLPDYEPPFAAKEWKPQAVELKIWDVPSKSGTEIQPYLICGNKKVGCRETSFGLKAPGICDQLMSVLIDGKVFASWQISGWIPGFDGGHPFKTKDGTTPEITADKEKQAFTFRKEYQLSKDETAVYTQTASPAGDGKVLFTYDMGISPEKFATLPKGSGLSPEFYFEKPSLDLGLSVNGERLKLIPLEELMALPKNQSGSIRKPLKTFEACDEIVVSPDNPAAGFTLRLRAKGKVAIFEGYYQGRRSLSLNLPCDPEKVNGSFVIDFGASAVADKDAPPPLCGVDFWKNDRMHIPAPTSRNLMPNPSFEQGLRYWNWFSTGSSKYEPQPGNAPCYELSDDAKFGHFALKCNGTWGNRPLMSFPIPVLNGKTYTVSFYAKALTPTNFTLGLGTMIENGTPGWPEALGKSWNAGTDWQRYSYTVKAGAPALQLFFAGPKNSTVFLDGLQLEEGEQVTDFVSPEVEGRLVTSDPDNSLQPGDTFNAAMEISGVPGISGEVLISVFDYYREKLYECKFPFVLDKDGLGKIALPMDYKTLGKGFFVVKAEYRVAGKEPIFDYYRLSVMDYLDKKHATNELFGNSCSASVITRGDDLARQFIRWGWGSTSVGGLDDVLLKYRITNYCAAIYWGLLDANQLKALFGENYKDYAHHGSLKFNILLDVLSADDKLPLIEQFSYEIAKKYPNQKRWSWDGELDGRSDLIRHGDFSGYAKLITAMHRGIKRAIPDAIVLPDQGPANANSLTQVAGVLSATKGKVKWDAVAIHHYGSPDSRDERTAALVATMKGQGYGDTPIYFTEGSAGGCSYFIPEWNKNPWDNRAGRPTYDTGWREFTNAAFGARTYLLTLKYWPQVQFATIWYGTPYLDLNFSPVPMCKMVNTLGHLFGNPKFVADIRPIEDVKGLAFEDADGRGLVAVWVTGEGGDVELGLKRGAKLRVDFGSDTPEFIDLMGNVRQVKPVSGLYEIPLSPAPLFIRGPKGAAARLAAALNKAEVVGGGSTVRADIIPGVDGKLTATLSNKTARELGGKLSVGQTLTQFKIPASGKTQITLASGLPTDPGKMQDWKDTLKISMDDGSIVDVNCSLAWFFVPQVSSPLPLDPDAPEWKAIPALPVSNWYFSPSRSAEQKAATVKLDAKFQLAWDKDNLYMRVDCSKDKFVLSSADKWRPQPSSLYNNDGCVEVYFDTYANARGNLKKGHDDDDYRYDFYAGNEKAVNGPGSVWRLYNVFEQYAGGIAQPNDKDCSSGKELKCEFRRDGGHYSYVMIFPLRYIMPIVLEKGSIAGFGLYIHDKDLGEKEPTKGLSLATEPGAHCNFRPDLYPLMILK